MAKELLLIPKAKYEFLTKRKDDENLSQVPEQSPAPEEYLETTLKYVVPKKDFNKAFGLWNYLKDRKGPLLSWNEHGEIIVKGIPIPGSHLIDLLKHTVSAFSPKIEPLGYEQFKTALAELHTPTGLMTSKVERQTGRGFVMGKTERGPPGLKEKQFRWIPY